MTFPAAQGFARATEAFLPVFIVSGDTLVMQGGAALAIACIASVVPAWRAAQGRIVDGLRSIG